MRFPHRTSSAAASSPQVLLAMVHSLRSFPDKLRQRLLDPVREENKTRLVALFLILGVALAVRARFLCEPMRYDEAYTFLNYASQPLHIGLSKYWTNNHLLNTFLVHVTYSVLGNRPWVIRLPVFIGGVLVVPAIYSATRALYDKNAAILAAGIAASSSALVEYSINARGYIFVSLFFLFVLAVGARVRRSAGMGAWTLFSVLAALGFYSIPIMLYPFGIVAVWIFLSIMWERSEAGRRIVLRRYFLSLLLVGLFTTLLYLPVLLVSGLSSLIGNDVVARDFVSESLAEYVPRFSSTLRLAWDHWHEDVPAPVKILLIIGFAVSLVFHGRLARHRVPLAVATVLWLAPFLAVQRASPPIRIWLFLVPLYVMLACAGISYAAKLGARKAAAHRPLMVAVLAVGISIWMGANVVHSRSVARPEGTLADAEEITFFLSDYLRAGDRVIATGGATSIMEYYFTLHGVPVEYLRSDARFGNRIVFIVNESKQRADEILHQRGLTVPENLSRAFPNYSMARLIRRYRYASLYELYRMRSGREG